MSSCTLFWSLFATAFVVIVSSTRLPDPIIQFNGSYPFPQPLPQSSFIDNSGNIWFVTNADPSYVVQFNPTTRSIDTYPSTPYNTGNQFLFTSVYDNTNNYVYMASSLQPYLVRVNLINGLVDQIQMDVSTFVSISAIVLSPDNTQLWVIGVRGTDTSYITNIPTNNFTQAVATERSVNYAGVLLKQQLNFAIYNKNDVRYIYLGSNAAPTPGSRPRVFRFNTVTLKFDRNVSISWDFPTPGSFNGTANLQGGFYDGHNDLLYLWAFGQNVPGRLTKLDPATFEQLDVLVFDPDLGAYAASAAFDQVGQQVFFGHANTPAVVTHVNLAQFQLISTVLMPQGLDSFLSGTVTQKGDAAVFATATDFSPSAVLIGLPPRCPNNCGGRGNCSFGECSCVDPWTAEACDFLKCPFNCSGNGVCNNGTCACTRNFTGDGCETRQCPNACSGNGNCMTSNYTCACSDVWYGDDCSLYPSVLPCYKYTSVDDCFKNSQCGWCADKAADAACLIGGHDGPYEGGCQRWAFAAAPYNGNFVLGWITNGVVLFVLFINIIATVISDLSAPENPKDRVFLYRYRWRTQQSAKIWQMVDQVQWIAITGYLAVDLPPVYSYFTNTFRWAILGFGLPWDTTKDGYLSSRTSMTGTPRWLLSLEQNASTILAWPDQVFLGNLFWLAVVLGGFLVIFVIFILFSLCLGNNFKTFARNRIFFTSLRVFMFGYLGLMCTASYTIIVYANDSIFARSNISTIAIAVAVVILFVIGLGMPLFTFVLLNGKKKELFDREFSMKFGCLFHNYHFKRSLFYIAVFLKKLAIGLIIGLLSRNHDSVYVAQIILLIVVQLLYFIVIVVIKPYLDHIHHFVDCALSVINIFSMLMMFGFVKTNGSYEDKFATATVAVLLHVVSVAIALVGWINSVFKMYNIRSFGQFIDALQGKHSSDPVEMSGQKR